MEKNEFHAIASFDRYIEAHLLLNRLLDENINCFLKDEFTVTIDPVLSNAVGGIKIMVNECQFRRAAELMAEWKADAEKNAVCPQCGHAPLELVSSGEKPANLVSGLLGFVLGNYAVAVQKKYRCFSCGAEYNELPRPDSEHTDAGH